MVLHFVQRQGEKLWANGTLIHYIYCLFSCILERNLTCCHNAKCNYICGVRVLLFVLLFFFFGPLCYLSFCFGLPIWYLQTFL